ncbi:MAG TPA: class I SAM-dependent methyltransferase [Candidatus Binataceae bacterium]|nr:class I SAM-dependent methyltransferase [Candidatus Binataceae bacterium]
MEKDKPSKTSEAAAVHRAVHQLFDDQPKILLDPIALRIAEMPKDIDLNLEASKPAFKQVRSRLVMRSRYAEDCLADTVAQRAIQQYLILGAGLDTFAFRQPSWARSIEIFEVDHPATQRDKRERLETAGLLAPANLHFAPVDFESTSLSDALRECGFDFGSGTFCSWLGVTYYLTEEAIDRTLEIVRRLPSGSEIVFEYALALELLSREEQEEIAADEASKKAMGINEPALSRFTPVQLNAKLRWIGFSEAMDFSPEDAQQRYFQGRRDGLSADPAYHLMRAIV